MLRFLLPLLIIAAQATAAVRIPIQVEPSPQVKAASWPVTAGVPFPQGTVKNVEALAVVDDQGKSVECQITRIEPWEDGSVRWAWVDFQPQPSRSYVLVEGKALAPAQAIKVQEAKDQITVDTGAAQYIFKTSDGCFDRINVGGKAIASNLGDGFYVMDSKGRRGVLHATECKVEMNGPMRTVVRVAGEYKTSDGARNGGAVIYHHFYAGRPEVRINHKFIVTEDTNDLWFREIGLRLPLAGGATATFNKPDAGLTDALAVPVKGQLVMLQKTYPHFGQRDSQCAIIGTDTKGAVAGNWADLSSAAGGLAAQIPAFAQTFPKAFAISPEGLTVKLWASEAGQELDFRTEKIMDWYFGHDWIPADNEVVKLKNNAQGTSRTHDIWLYPHAGALDAKTIETFGAVAEPTYAKADAQWTADSGVFGPIHPCDAKRFPSAERAIEDYFNRAEGFPLKLFPTNGYLYYRGYPYAAQSWAVKNGQWYPEIHRLSRNLEYNFKRHIWILAMRNPQRKYYDLARDYTRFQHDMLWSNFDTEDKPTRGRLYQGSFHSPIVWSGKGAYLAAASSEDVIQFVYDYLIAGEYQSRDMVEAWIAAFKQEYGEDVAKAVADQDRTDSLLRIMGSAYELHHDPYLAKFSHGFLEHTVDPKHEIGLHLDGSQIAKTGDVYSAYFYNWVHTRDPLALVALKRYAEFDYRRGRLRFMARSSAIPMAYAMKYFADGDKNYAALVASWMHSYSESGPTLAQMGIDPAAIKHDYTGPWAQHILTGGSPVFYGLPMAMATVVKSGVLLGGRPLADKPYPTQRAYLLLNRTDTNEALLDVCVNNFGDLTNTPKLYDAKGNVAPLEVIERDEHRVTKPPGVKGMQAHAEYYSTYESFIFYRLKIPTGGTKGAHYLDLGDQVSYKLLNSTLPQAIIAAPDGLVLQEGHSYYFPLAAGQKELIAFSHRPVVIEGPDGKVVWQPSVAAPAAKAAAAARPAKKSASTGQEGKITIALSGVGGTYSVHSVSDEYLGPGSASTETFFRLHNAPLVLAMDDPSRLFAVDTARYPSSEPANAREMPAGGFAFVDAGKFGKSALFAGKIVSLPTEASASNPPHDKGTVEFWWRPRWAASDFSMADTTQRLQLFSLGPVGLMYYADSPNVGRTPNYNESRIGMNLLKTKEAKRYESDTRAIIYPTAGQWYHIALTWNIDGSNSEIDIYTNGRKRSYCHYENGLPRTAAPADLAAMTDAIRFGSARLSGWTPGGDEFDELRISRSVRYKEDFTPPTQPFAPDADTWVLMHFDGDLKAVRNGEAVEATAKAEKRLY